MDILHRLKDIMSDSKGKWLMAVMVCGLLTVPLMLIMGGHATPMQKDMLLAIVVVVADNILPFVAFYGRYDGTGLNGDFQQIKINAKKKQLTIAAVNAGMVLVLLLCLHFLPKTVFVTRAFMGVLIVWDLCLAANALTAYRHKQRIRMLRKEQETNRFFVQCYTPMFWMNVGEFFVS